MNKKKMIYSIVFGLLISIILTNWWMDDVLGILFGDYDTIFPPIYSAPFGMTIRMYVIVILTSTSLLFGFGFYYFSDKIKNLLIRINLISTKSENESTKSENVSTKSENVSDTSLSHKYSVLLKYKVLVYILMVIDTIYSFKTLFGGGLDDKVISYVVIAYIISMFSLYCLILMIHFLFDLDKKTDNNV